MNFRKYIAIGSLAVLGLVGCATSHPAPVVVNAPPPPPIVVPAPVVTPAPAPEATNKLTVGKASVTLPDGSWETQDSPPGIGVVQNDDAEVRFMLTNDKIKDTTLAEFDAVVLKGVSKFKGKLISTKHVTFNDQDVIFHKTVNGHMAVFVWVTAKDNFGYVIMCGSPSNPNAEKVCTSLADTLTIE